MILTKRQIWTQAFLFLGAILALHYTCLYFFPKAELDVYDISDFYPLSVFNFRRTFLAWHWVGAGLLALACWVAAPWLSRPRAFLLVWAFAFGLAFSSNLIHGWTFGIDYPTATWGDSGIEYYHDAVLVKSAAWFLGRFNQIQAALLEHARTHPPGPVLYYYFLAKALPSPAAISLASGAIATGLFLFYWRRLCWRFFGRDLGESVLGAVLPAMLIYSIAVIDAVLAGVFLACLAHFVADDRAKSAVLCGAWMALGLFFTFGALFLIPLILGASVISRRLWRGLLAFLVAAALLASLKLLGFDWWAAFRAAAKLENEQGFLLFAHPRRYLWYRLGAVAEIFFFFTPFLLALAWRGLPLLRMANPGVTRLAWLGPLILLAMLLAGMLKIGEAGRVCIFITPFLLLPVARAWRVLEAPSRVSALRAVMLWAVAMQLFGFYQW